MTHAFGLLRQSIEAELTSVKKLSKQDKVNYAVSEKDHRATDLTTLTRMTGCTRMFWAATGLLGAAMGCNRLYWAILSSTGLLWAVLCCTLLYWAVLGCTRLYLAVLGCTKLYWAVLGCSGL